MQKTSCSIAEALHKIFISLIRRTVSIDRGVKVLVLKELISLILKEERIIGFIFIPFINFLLAGQRSIFEMLLSHCQVRVDSFSKLHLDNLRGCFSWFWERLLFLYFKILVFEYFSRYWLRTRGFFNLWTRGFVNFRKDFFN